MNLSQVIRNFKEVVGRGVPLDIFLVSVVILVGTGSFGLGRMSIKETRKEEVQIVYQDEKKPAIAAVATSLPVPKQNASPGAAPQEGRVVASKNGTKYHLPWCPGADRISEGNKIWFASEDEAKKAGYSPAANCKGI